MTRVSAVLIVRDEAEFIEGCLRSLVGNVDEIVLVDTGSRDGTLGIAGRFPIRPHHFAWCDDFSAARNFALAQARSEWILYIDADERLDAPDRHAWSRCLSDRGKVAWKVRFHPRVGWTAYSEMRLFRNDPRIRFEGAIHENPWPSINAVAHADGLGVGCCDISIHHVGYEADQRPKNPRNIPLLRAALARDPDHFFCWWHLGECLRLAGDEDAAAGAWSRGIHRLRVQHPDRRQPSHSLLYLALLQLEYGRGAAIDDLMAEALGLFPDNLALQWMTARLAVDRDDLERARGVLRRLAAVDGDAFFEPDMAYDKAIFGHLSAELLALCEFRSGRFADAARLYRQAAQTSPAPAACDLKARLSDLRATG
jgi:tetratricopeptide (TPR) repeat protein